MRAPGFHPTDPGRTDAIGGTVRFNPEIALAATLQRMEVTFLHGKKIQRRKSSYAPAWRAWVIARAISKSGDVAIEEFYKASDAARINRRTIERGVNQARELGWLRKIPGKTRPDRFVIASQKTLALDLNKEPGAHQVEISLKRLSRPAWRAHIFAAWEEAFNRQAFYTLRSREEIQTGKNPVKKHARQLRPVSRRVQAELIGINRFTAARYDRQAGTVRTKNWLITDHSADCVPMAQEHGQPAVAIDGKLAIRKPDSKTVKGVVVSKFGRGRNIHQALIKRGASFHPQSYSDAASSARPRPGKQFCTTPKEASTLADSIIRYEQKPREIYLKDGKSFKGSTIWRLA